MPALLPRGHLVAKAQPISGLAQMVVAGPVLYFGIRALNLQAAAVTNINVTDAVAPGGPLIDVLNLAAAAGGSTDNRTVAIRTESGLFVDGGGAGNANIIVYYLPLEYVASLQGLIPESFFAENED